MKKLISLIALALVVISCGGVKSSQQALNSGNYDYAISEALEKLIKTKGQKKTEAYALILEDAFQKNASAGQEQIAGWIADGHPENYKLIYDELMALHRIQERVKPLMPIRLNEAQRLAVFNFEDYTGRIIAYRTKVSAYLYAQSLQIIGQAQYKPEFRLAYETLSELESINPNYRNTRALISETREKAMYHVLMRFENLTDFEIPKTLELELMDLGSENQRNPWAQFHRYPETDLAYDYEIILALREVIVSPNQVIEKNEVFEKKISEGKQLVLNREGKAVMDSLGNPLEVERFVKVKSRFQTIQQEKSGFVSGSVAIVDNHSGETLEMLQLSGQTHFEHRYAVQRGDERALEKWQLRLLKNRPVPFPSHFDMASAASAAFRSEIWDALQGYNFE